MSPVRVGRRQLPASWGGIHCRYVEAEDARVAVVLLHQSPLSSRRFQPLLGEVGEWADGYALDTPGYGESDLPPEAWEVEDYAAAFWAAVEELTDLPVLLLGRATGSVMALEMAGQRPERLHHLVLFGLPVYTPAECADRLAGFAPPYDVAADGSHLQWIWRRAQGEYPWASPELLTSFVADYLAAGPDFATGYRAIWRYDLAAAVGRLPESLPVTLVAGGRDRIGFMHERARAALPSASEVVLPEATDFVAEQDPVGFSRLLRTIAVGAPGRL